MGKEESSIEMSKADYSSEQTIDPVLGFGNLLQAAGVLSFMSRGSIVGVSGGLVLLACTFPLLHRFRAATLPSDVLMLRSTKPPEGWADDCARLLRAVRNSDSRSVENNAALGEDAVAIYRAVLESWQSNEPTALNLSDMTIPLDPLSPAGISDCECLKGIDVQSLGNASHSFHRLRRDLLPSHGFRLVNAVSQIQIVRSNDPGNRIDKGKSIKKAVDDAFAAGLFTMSEIAFDKQHRRALVMFSFVCGSLCGSGGVWLFEKVDGTWKRADRLCGGWVS